MATSWDSSAVSRVEVDEVWKAVGRYGRYQVVQILTLSMAGMSLSYPVLSVIFEGSTNPHKCRPPASFLSEYDLVGDANGSVVRSSCAVQVIRNNSEEREFLTSTCDGYDYLQPQYASFTSEWGLVCDKAPLVQLSQTMVMAGMFAGATLLSNLADRFGRKRAHVSCHVALFVMSLALAFMPNFVSFAACKFFVGVFQQGYMIPLVIYLLEILPTEQRAFMGMFSAVLWAFSIMSMAPLAFVLKNYSWRDTQIVFAMMHAVCFLEIFVLDESLRWLVANHRFADIRHVICKASKYNHRDPQEVFSTALARTDALRRTGTEFRADAEQILLSPITEEPEEEVVPDSSREEGEGNREAEVNQGRTEEESSGQEEAREEEEEMDVIMPVHTEGFFDLIKDPDMRFLTLTMLYVWMTNSLTYYGITLLSSSLAGNPYLNFFLGGLIEIPSCGVMWLGLSRFGRKATTITFISLAGVSLLGASFLAAFAGDTEVTGILQTTLTLVARFGITGSFNAIWVYTPELFPTNIRNLGVGIASSSARIGGMAAPFFKLLSDVAIWAPGIIFSCSCLVVVFLLSLLPETRHRSLPQTISDVRTWRRESQKGKD